MKKSLAIAAAVLVSSVTLTACGGDSGDDYCDELESLQTDFADATDFSSDQASKVLDQFSELADAAPDEVSDDWKTIQSALSGFQKGLKDAGVDLDNLEDLDPASLNEEQVATLQEAYTGLADEKTTAAFTNVEDHAKSECDIDLNDSGAAAE